MAGYNQCKCGSYAVNDDPKLELCDRCWRDARIATLEAALRPFAEKAKQLPDGFSGIAGWKFLEINTDHWRAAASAMEESDG